MFDRNALRWAGPGLDRAAAALVRLGVGANAITLAGFALGLGAAVAIAFECYLSGLGLIAASRLADGLDGAVARQTQPTDTGAFLDIALDFVFYASVPLAFAWARPEANALAAAVLLFSFMGTASSFLAFAVMAERRGLSASAYPTKGLYYLGGLTEGSETLLCFALMCLWPRQFAALAYGFSALCGLTWATRMYAGWSLLKDR